MSETYRVGDVRYRGEKPNPHGGVLHKFYVTLEGNAATFEDVYWQRKSPDLESGTQVYGHIENGEYGPRFKTDQRPDGGNQTFNVGRYERVPDNSDRSRRIERQHSQDMGLRALALLYGTDPAPSDVEGFRREIRAWTDHFQQDLDADVGGGNQEPTNPTQAAADVSADVRTTDGTTASHPDEASPQLKGKATQLLNKAGLAEGARKAVILFRCGTLKNPPKGRVQRLVRDLEDGATAKALLDEISDARANGDEVATEAAKLIPSDVPLSESEPEVVEPNGESAVPF